MLEFPAKQFNSILQKRNISVDLLAHRAKISRAKLQKISASGGSLNDEEASQLAEELAVPLTAFFVNQDIPTAVLIDFRTKQNELIVPRRSLLSALRYVEHISATLVGVGANTELSPELNPIECGFSTREAKVLAAKWRSKWGLTISQQLEMSDAGKLYDHLRKYIESLGAFVMHCSIDDRRVSGFYTKVNGGPHTIVINTKSNNTGRRSFTLAHEFGHLITRKEGVSNVSNIKNKIERFCNKFAALLLAPAKLIEQAVSAYYREVSPDNEYIRLFAKWIGLSQEATFIRLVETSLLSEAQFKQWKSQFDGRIPTGDLPSGGGGGGGDPVKAKITKYGYSLVRELASAYHREELDEIDIFRITRLKPHFQHALFIDNFAL